MGKRATEQENLRQAKARLRRIQHYEQVTHNVSQTCRFFGVSRRQFYTWLRRYREQGLEGLKNLKSGSRSVASSLSPAHLPTLSEEGRSWERRQPSRRNSGRQRHGSYGFSTTSRSRTTSPTPAASLASHGASSIPGCVGIASRASRDSRTSNRDRAGHTSPRRPTSSPSSPGSPPSPRTARSAC